MGDPPLGLLGTIPADRDPQAAFDTGAARLAGAGFALRNGSVEVALLEAHAVLEADIAYAAGRVPAAMVETLAVLLALARRPGTASTGLVEVVLDPPATLTVPAGLRLRVPATGDGLVTTGPVAVVAAATVVLPVAAADAGPVAVAVGTGLDLLDAVPGAAAATVVAAVAGGTAEETWWEWLLRAQVLTAITRAAVNHAAQYQALVPVLAAGVLARAVDLWDPGSGHEAGADGGHVTVVVWGPGGATPGDVRAALAARLRGMSEAGKTVHVVGAPVTVVDLAVRVQAAGDPVAVRDAVAGALRAWCDPGAWEWDRMVRVLDVAAVAGAVPGVASVLAVDSPSADVPVPGPGGLARAGTVTVVVGPDSGI